MSQLITDHGEPNADGGDGEWSLRTVPDFGWFTCYLAGAEVLRQARELAEAEHAARAAGYIVRWDPTWTCDLLPGRDPEGRIAYREHVDLDTHPATDPRAREIERELLVSAPVGTPDMAGGFYIEWRAEPTCRVYAPGGRTLLFEDNEAAPRDPDSERYEAALILRENLGGGVLALPGRDDRCGQRQ